MGVGKPCELGEDSGENGLGVTVERLLERAMRIELTASAWEAEVLPLYDARSGRFGTATRPYSVTVDPHNRPSGNILDGNYAHQAGVSGYCQPA